MPKHTGQHDKPDFPFHVGIFDTYIEDIRCRIYYPSGPTPKYITKLNDTRKIKDNSNEDIVFKTYFKFGLTVLLGAIFKFLTWPRVYNFILNNYSKSKWFKINSKTQKFVKNDMNRSVPYEVESCMTGFSTFDVGKDKHLKTPDENMLREMMSDNLVQRIILFHNGVGAGIDNNYTNFCIRMAKEMKALVVVPAFSCGTMVYHYDRKNEKHVEYSYHIPMWTNSPERKMQNDIRSEESYRIVQALKSLCTTGKSKPFSAVGHSFGGTSVVHLQAENPKLVSDCFDSIVSLGGSLGVGITDQDWGRILRKEYSTRSLQIYETNYKASKDPRQLSCFNRTFVGEKISKISNDKNPQKNYVYTVQNTDHWDLGDDYFEHTYSEGITKFLAYCILKYSGSLCLSENPKKSFEDQLELTKAFIEGESSFEKCVNERNGGRFVVGIPNKEKVDEKRVEESVRRLLKC